MRPPPIVRPVTPGDIPRIADLHVTCWQHAYPGLLPQAFLDALSRERRERQWAHALAHQTCALLLAEAAGEVLGFAAYGRCRDPGAAPSDHELWALHVAAGHWRHGVGKLLWQQVQQDFMAAGAQSISLWVLEGNERARKFYEAVGFGLQPESVKVENIGGADAVEVRYAMQPAPSGVKQPESSMGATANIRILTKAELERLSSSPGHVEDLLFPDDVEDPFAGQAELDKAWHGIHYVLCGSHEPDGSPLGDAILGGTPIGPDLGYGKARLVAASRVREIDAALRQVDFAAAFARADKSPAMLDRIYLGEHLPEEYDYLAQYFPAVVSAYAEAAGRECAVLVYLA